MNNKLKYNYTPQELKIIELLVLGLTNKEISKKLFMSVSTVKTHLENIYIKTGINNRVEFAVFAVKQLLNK